MASINIAAITETAGGGTGHWHWEASESRGRSTLAHAPLPHRTTNPWACECSAKITHKLQLNRASARYEPGDSLITHREAW